MPTDAAEATAIRTALVAMLPGSVAVAVRRIGAELAVLPGEARAMARMSEARRAEFSTGRAAIREATLALGLPPPDVAMGTDRAPVWPQGLTGALAHGAGWALALAARARDVRALGVDVEADCGLDRALWQTVMRSEERQSADASHAPGAWAKTAFVAKECTYKAQYVLSGQMLDFTDLSISLNGNRFTATFRRAALPFTVGSRLEGKFVRTGGLVLGALAI